MLRVAVVGLALTLVVPPGLAAAPIQSVFHQEVQSLLDQAVSGLGGFLAQLQRHLDLGSNPMDGPGSGPGAPSPAERPLISIMLHHRTEIGLTPDQVTKLESLRDAFAHEAIRRDADIRIAELDLQGLLAAEPVDMAKVEAKVRQLAQLRADLRVARLKTIEQGKAILTPEQKTRLQSVLSGGPGSRPSAHGAVQL